MTKRVSVRRTSPGRLEFQEAKMETGGCTVRVLWSFRIIKWSQMCNLSGLFLTEWSLRGIKLNQIRKSVRGRMTGWSFRRKK